MMIFYLVSGFLLLFAGRNLFWLCVGIAGFLVGAQCAVLLGLSKGWLVLGCAMALGCMGAGLAVFFEWVTVIFGVGFLGGGYLLMNMFWAMVPHQLFEWPIFVLGGIVGTFLLVIIFDFTLIVISSLLGSALIIQAFHGSQQAGAWLFLSCALTGIVVQCLSSRGTAKQGRFARRSG